jgi:hypothetical protein
MFLFFTTILSLLCCVTSQSGKAQQIDTLQYIEQTDNDYLSVFLDIDFAGKVDIFDVPNGKRIKSVQNDTEESDIIMFDLLQKKDSMYYYVIAYSGIDDEILAKGWIKKDNHLGVYSAAYGEQHCSLYELPFNREKIIVTENEYNPNMYEVIDFEGKWLKVKIKIKDKIYIGWMPPEMQCSNPYTTCN